MANFELVHVVTIGALMGIAGFGTGAYFVDYFGPAEAQEPLFGEVPQVVERLDGEGRQVLVLQTNSCLNGITSYHIPREGIAVRCGQPGDEDIQHAAPLPTSP